MSNLSEQVQNALLTALSDPESRTILRATADRTLTANELSDKLDISLSTLSRKLNELVDASLVEETLRLAPDGKHLSQYHCAIDKVHIQMSKAGERVLNIDVFNGLEVNCS